MTKAVAARRPAALPARPVPPAAIGAARRSRPIRRSSPSRRRISRQWRSARCCSQCSTPVNTAQRPFGGGAGEEAWKPMLVQEFAKQIAAHGGLGLAKPVYDAMMRMQEAKPK